jgi:hypothetical protein
VGDDVTGFIANVDSGEGKYRITSQFDSLEVHGYVCVYVDSGT